MITALLFSWLSLQRARPRTKRWSGYARRLLSKLWQRQTSSGSLGDIQANQRNSGNGLAVFFRATSSTCFRTEATFTVGGRTSNRTTVHDKGTWKATEGIVELKSDPEVTWELEDIVGTIGTSPFIAAHRIKR
jgi:hypothetical protein